MAKFELELPREITADIEKVYGNADKIFGEMTRAGADVVAHKMKDTAPLPALAEHIRLSKTYRTPSDDGINTKVYFTGYLPFSGNRKTFKRRAKAGGRVYTTTKGVPAAFVAQIYEYGRSTNPFPKKPFMRKAFKGNDIVQAMLKKQKEASGGILDAEANRNQEWLDWGK